ncbi:MAG: class III poly(R)-hydroxyalkanoic acid synthase subunit PhaC, partial [Betaproteobacteria bacterium]
MKGRIQIDSQEALKAFTDFNQKMLRGKDLLERIKGDDVQIATTPKREVFRQDKMVLYRYQ